ncbi:protein of unknown function [Paraburkholderia kururiensis]
MIGAAALRFAFCAPRHDAQTWLQVWYSDTFAIQRGAEGETNTERYRSGGDASACAKVKVLAPQQAPVILGRPSLGAASVAKRWCSTRS